MTASLIDLHAHYLTEHYVEQARKAGHPGPDGMPAWAGWDPESHLALMNQNNIERSILSLSSPGVHFGDNDAARALARTMNQFASTVARARPDRFGFFATLPLPDVDGAIDELDHACDVLGAHGVAVQTNYHGTYLSDPTLEPLFAELDRRRAVLLVHPTGPSCRPGLAHQPPPPVLEFLFETTRTVIDLILGGVTARHPGVRLLIPHGGAVLPLVAPRIRMFRTRLGLSPAGIEDELGRLWFDMAGTPFPLQIPTLCEVVGHEHLVFGSDYCFTPPTDLAAQVEAMENASCPVADSTWPAVTTRNAKVLLQ